MLPKTMKAIVLTAHGGLDKLVYRDDVPVPTCNAGEVLLEVTACGLNNTDVWVRQGAYGTDDDPQAVSTWRRGRSTLTFPRIQGADIVGRVIAVGSGVSDARIGERVIVDASIYNRDDDSLADIDYIGHGRDGGYAEYTAVPAENAHRVDSSYTDAELATFWCAYHTGEQMIERAAVKSGETVLITGASGGVGSGIASGLATGLGVGAGIVAGEALADRLLHGGSHEREALPPGTVPERYNDDLGGKDFGISDGGSWDDGGGGFSDDSGGGGDWT
jgi:NADPH:quinone reductase-like Zn-dependent oxidoreductase